jgi:glyoxylase-like metal-dependent hydrolase (beta-lactamase superfamily II)
LYVKKHSDDPGDCLPSAAAHTRYDVKTHSVSPFATPPEPGQVLEVAPGVVWMRMPLPMALNHINVWGLADEDGWAVVDTGMRTDETLGAWRALFASSDDQRPLTRVFATHMHPDHIGMAGWLTRKFKCRLWMTRMEYLNCRVLTADSGREAPADAVAFYRQAGWSDAAIENYQARFGNFGKYIHALPDSYRRMVDGEEIRIGAHTWRVIVGTGHSPEHACLYCADLKLLISGDQVLPRISSNVSVHPTEPDADPMREWLESLDKLKREVPDDVLVCPRTTTAFAVCTPVWTTWPLLSTAPWTGCAKRSRSPGARWRCSRPCLAGSSRRPMAACSTWPRAKASLA